MSDDSLRVFWLVRLLAVLALAAIAGIIGVVGWQLGSIHTERTTLQIQQAELAQTSQQILVRSADARQEILAILDENGLEGPSNAADTLTTHVDRLLVSSATDVLEPALLKRLNMMSHSLAGLERKALAWREQYSAILQDITTQRSIGNVRDQIAALRGAVEMSVGKQRLKEAVQFKRWRAAQGGEAAKLAQAIVENQLKEQVGGTDDIDPELAEIGSLIERLAGEYRLDHLVDLKDNKFTSVLDRLSRSVAGAQELLLVEQLKTALFGRGFEMDSAHQTIHVGTGGFYALQWRTVQLRYEREILRNERAILASAIEGVVLAFMHSAHSRADALNDLMQQRVTTNWQRMMGFGAGCSALFLGLTWLILRAVRGQVDAIDHAKSEAESGRLTAQRLMQDLRALHVDHELILNSMVEGIHRIDKNGKIVFENPASARMLGWDAGDLIGLPAHATMHHRRADGSEHPQAECLIYATLQTGKESRVNGEVFWRKDGTSFPVEYTTTPVRGEPGEILGALVVFNDVTERKRAEEVLRGTEERFRLFAENSPDAFWMVSVDFQTLHYISPAFEDIWGRSIQDLYANNNLWINAVVPEDLERIRAAFQKLATEREITTEYSLRRPDGSIRCIFVRGFQVRDVDGKLCGAAGISTDITERRRAEDDLENAHKQLVIAARQAGMAEVASSVLHNAGNVLNSVNVSAAVVTDQIKHSKMAGLKKISTLLNEHAGRLPEFFLHDPRAKELPGYVEMLANYWIQEQTMAVTELELLNGNIQHIKEIIATQQSLTGIRSFEEPVKLSHVIENALKIATADFERNPIAIERDLEPMPLMLIDKSKLLQILINLLQNAKDAISKLSTTVRKIRIRTVRTINTFTVEVTDNGVGIRSENLIRMFSFGFTTKATGHGIGLHISALNAQELGGSLTAASPGPNEGATFTLELPFKALELRK